MWLSKMKKYFQIYNYSNELKEQMSIYNLTRKEDILCEEIKKVKGMKERYVTWKTFKKIFKTKYLSEQYYEENVKDFYELRIETMPMK